MSVDVVGLDALEVIVATRLAVHLGQVAKRVLIVATRRGELRPISERVRLHVLDRNGVDLLRHLLLARATAVPARATETSLRAPVVGTGERPLI